jgi:hypothetical protein
LKTFENTSKTLSVPADFAIASDVNEAHANKKIQDTPFHKIDDRGHEFAAQAVDSADVPFSRTCVALIGRTGTRIGSSTITRSET